MLLRWRCGDSSCSACNGSGAVGSGEHLASALDGLRALGFILQLATRRNIQPALHRGPRSDEIEPAFEVWQTIEREARPLVAAHPAEGCDVGYRIGAREIFIRGQPVIEHLEQTATLTVITIDRVWNLLRRVAEEYVRLPHHRTDARHLKHEPLDDERAPLRIVRHELAGLLREIHEDRAAFEHGEVAVAMIDDRWD